MKKVLFLVLACLGSMSLMARSIIFTLNDAAKTRIYYKVTTSTSVDMKIGDDGSFSVNGTPYSFSNVECFQVSSTDYSGEKNTVDAIVEMTDDQVKMGGSICVYTTDGKLVRKADSMAEIGSLKSGAYVITNGVSTMKIMKR